MTADQNAPRPDDEMFAAADRIEHSQPELAEWLRSAARTMANKPIAYHELISERDVLIDAALGHALLVARAINRNESSSVKSAAMNIVNQLAELWNVPVDVRQATNDQADQFVTGLVDRARGDRAEIVADLRFLAEARGDYCRRCPQNAGDYEQMTSMDVSLHAEHASAAWLADIIHGSNGSQGWLPSHRWPEWSERLARRTSNEPGPELEVPADAPTPAAPVFTEARYMRTVGGDLSATCFDCGDDVDMSGIPTCANPECPGKQRPPMRHVLKTVQPFYDAVYDRTKQFDIRKHDRDFRVGDWLRLLEWIDGEGTGRTQDVVITYVMTDPKYVLPGHVVLGIRDPQLRDYDEKPEWED